MGMNKHVMIYITAADRRQALRIGKILVQERLAACINILGRIDSIYWWEGRVQQGKEVSFVAKTRAALSKAVIRRVRELHSYHVPCAVAVPVADGNPAFLQWISAETAQPKRPVRARKQKP